MAAVESPVALEVGLSVLARALRTLLETVWPRTRWKVELDPAVDDAGLEAPVVVAEGC
jgi:hypothetical protein